MNIDNVFDFLVDVVFSVSPQLRGLIPKAQELMISFFAMAKGEPSQNSN